MTDNNHPITPPPELAEKWLESTRSNDCIGAYPQDYEQQIATQAARWGADRELEECCHLLRLQGFDVVDDLRAARRPKPPSLKEQAKFAAAVLRSPDETCSIAELQQHWHTICTALEQLDD